MRSRSDAGGPAGKSWVDVGIAKDEAHIWRVDLSVNSHDGLALAKDARSMLAARFVTDFHRADCVRLVISTRAEIDVQADCRKKRGQPQLVDELGRLRAPKSSPSTVFVFKLRSKIPVTPPIGRLLSLGVTKSSWISEARIVLAEPAPVMKVWSASSLVRPAPTVYVPTYCATKRFLFSSRLLRIPVVPGPGC